MSWFYKNEPPNAKILHVARAAITLGPDVLITDQAIYFLKDPPFPILRMDVAEAERRLWTEVSSIAVRSNLVHFLLGRVGLRILFRDNTSVSFADTDLRRRIDFSKRFNTMFLNSGRWLDRVDVFRLRQVVGLTVSGMLAIAFMRALAWFIMPDSQMIKWGWP